MKAPDKICIRKDDTAPFGFTRHWIYTTKVQEHDIEYIRKEAMLEYLTNKMEQMRIEAKRCYNMTAAGKFLALKNLVEKIESL